MTARARLVDAAALPAAVARLIAGSSDVIVPSGGGLVVPEAILVAARAGLPDGGVVVATSGSTGRPRWVMLPTAALVAGATATQAWLGAAGRWLTALPTHYVAGLMTLVRALVDGTAWGSVAPHLDDLALRLAAASTGWISAPAMDQGGSSRPDQAAGAAGDWPTYLAIVPTQLQIALSEPDTRAALAQLTAVLVGGARLAPALGQAAAGAGINLVQTYGMSETAGGVVYNGLPLPGVRIDLSPIADDQLDEPLGDQRTGPVQGPADGLRGTQPGSGAARLWGLPPRPGVAGSADGDAPGASAAPEVPAVAAAGGTDSGRGAEPYQGRIVITAPSVCAGYAGDPAATAAVLTGQTFTTQDRGRLRDGRLEVLGRLDDVVISGGINVDLTQVQAWLDEIWGAERLVAFAVPDIRWGARIMAAARWSITADEIDQGLGDRVTAAARPRGVLVIRDWPLTRSGKLDRRRLMELWQEEHGDSQ